MIAPGTRLGSYEVIAQIGAGGMGEVYRATDTNLRRQVAVKVLPGSLANDPDRLARFEREARTLAALNHPNIAAIYGVERAGGQTAIVMELVDGPTLADRLARGRVPMQEAVSIATQVADALEASHEQGIIHRDLKPGNIKVRPDGTVKVLDFGLAKTNAPAGPAASNVSMSPTLTASAITQGGLIVGTAAYMSPEQARGESVDRRTDIWAFGCVLYEMVTGRRAFPGGSLATTLSAIITREPEWSTLPAETPAAVQRLLRRSLHKDRKRRLADIADARLELEEAFASPSAADSWARSPRRLRDAFAGLLAGVGLAAITSVGYIRSTAVPQPSVRFEMALPQSRNLGNNELALSPDGEQLAYVAPGPTGEDVLWVRRFDALEPSMLRGTESAYAPFWAPDGLSLAFFAGGKLKRMPVGGGPILTVCDVVAPASGAAGAWSRDGDIVYAQAFGPLHRVPADGGEPRPVTTLDPSWEEFGHYTPRFLPDGRRFTYWAGAAGPNSGTYVGSVDSMARIRVPLPVAPEAISDSGLVLFRDGGLLRAQYLDLERVELEGRPVPVADDVESVAISDTGTLAYRITSRTRRQLTWFDRAGRRLGVVGNPGEYDAPALSPDETRVAVGRAGDIWLLDLQRGSETRLTSDPIPENYPVWSPDGRDILFMRGGGVGALVRKPATGAGSEEVLVTSGAVPFGWSADGRFVTYLSFSPATFADMYVLPLFGDRQPMVFRQTRFQEAEHRLSPDGRWMVYTSNESGSPQVFVETFPASDQRWLVSTNPGAQPVWRADGRELFYLGMDGVLMAVDVQTSPDFMSGLPRPQFQTNAPIERVRNSFVPSRDGRRFLVSVVPEETSSRVVIVLNWTVDDSTSR